MSTTTYVPAQTPGSRARVKTPVVPATKGIASHTGVWVAVSAIAMSFAALTSALIVRQGSGSDWQRFVLPRILYFDTVILIASSYTLELSRKRFATVSSLRGAASKSALVDTAALRSSGLYWLNMTLTLGLLFIVGQFLAWRGLASQGLFLATSPSSSFFLRFDGDAWSASVGGCSWPDLRGLSVASEQTQCPNEFGDCGGVLAFCGSVMGLSLDGDRGTNVSNLREAL